MKIYISGKIGNLDMVTVRTKFNSAEIDLHTLGYFTVNPLDIHTEGSPYPNPSTWAEYMLNDIAYLFDCDAIYMLYDWEDSPGAKVEHAIAKAMNKPVWYQADCDIPSVAQLQREGLARAI